MNDLETRLSDTMRRHDAEAPTGAEIAALRPQAGVSRHRPARLIAVAAVTALVVVGAGIVGLQWQHHQPEPTRPTPVGTVLFVIGTPGARDGALVPVDVVASRGGAGALRALFSYRPTAGRSNPWSGVTLNSVVHRGGFWRVDIDRAPSWTGDDPETVMQSLAWTLSAATGSGDQIAITLDRRPLRITGGAAVLTGAPMRSYLSEAGKKVTWADRTCGSTRGVAVVAGRKVAADERGNLVFRAAHLSPTVTIRVGDTVRFLPDGLCFRPYTLMATRVPGASLNGIGSDVWTAHRVGRYVIALGGGMCTPSGFTQDYGRGCVGGFAMPAAILVQVVAH